MKHIYNILVATVALALASCSDRYTPAEMSGVIWGTTYHIVYDASGAKAGDTEAAVLEALNRVSSAANAFDSTSELGRLNATGSVTDASSTFTELVRRGTVLCEMSSGAFDPSVGPLVDLWGFGAGSGETTDSITEADIERILASTGMRGVSLEGNTVRLSIPGSRLDFAAFAKGYGVDCAAEALIDCGVRNCLVEIGGEVRAVGRNMDGRHWTIQIDAPMPDTTGRHSRLAVLELTANDVAVATSGNYRNFRTTVGGKTIGHTIDPRTGRPAESDVLSATIVARSATTADALATACMVLGSKDSQQLIEALVQNPDADVYGAILVTSAGRDKYDLHTVGLQSGARIQ